MRVYSTLSVHSSLRHHTHTDHCYHNVYTVPVHKDSSPLHLSRITSLSIQSLYVRHHPGRRESLMVFDGDSRFRFGEPLQCLADPLADLKAIGYDVTSVFGLCMTRDGLHLMCHSRYS